MKKLVIMHNTSACKEHLEHIAPGWEMIVTNEPELAKKHVAEAEILAGGNASVVQAGLNSTTLKWIQTWGAGVDSLPLDDLRRKGIILTNASGVHALPITESMFGLILSFARGLHFAMHKQIKREWGKDHPSLTEIHGKTLGILGVGAIGLEAARIGKAFGMRILGLRRNAEPLQYVDAMYTTGQINALLPECDYVMNVLPYTPETHHVMNADRFALMKPSACYISAGRGKTTDQEALIFALKNGIIACAGLDVTDPEPLPSDSPLWEMENVIITPHISGGTDRYASRAYEIFIENLIAYVQTGRPVRNLVDYELKY